MPRPDSPDPPETGASSSHFSRLLRSPSLWLTLVVLAVAGVVILLQARGPVVGTTRVTRTDIQQHIVSSGRVRVTTRVQLAAQVAGRVTAVQVREGQTVAPGQVLVQLDDAEARAAVAQARASVAQAQGRVEQLQRVGAVVTTQSSSQAATNVARAEAELARATSLAAAGAVSQVALEEAQRARDIALAQQRAADAQQTAAGPEGADSRVALATLAEGEARLSAALSRLAQTQIVARQAGTILTRMVEPGDTIQPGVTLIEMAATGITELVIAPDERNLAWIRLGQVARASADAWPDDTFEATVSYIAPSIDVRRGSVEVRLEVSDPPAYLRPDMTVSVDLTVASKTGVVAVPSDALRGSSSGEQFVWVVRDGHIEQRAVTVGIRGDGHTEIASGLDPDTEVVLTTDRVLDDGQRVRVSRPDR